MGYGRRGLQVHAGARQGIQGLQPGRCRDGRCKRLPLPQSEDGPVESSGTLTGLDAERKRGGKNRAAGTGPFGRLRWLWGSSPSESTRGYGWSNGQGTSQGLRGLQPGRFGKNAPSRPRICRPHAQGDRRMVDSDALWRPKISPVPLQQTAGARPWSFRWLWRLRSSPRTPLQVHARTRQGVQGLQPGRKCRLSSSHAYSG